MASSALDALIQALRRLPGVGVKSAARMAYHLMQHDRPGAQQLSEALRQAALAVQHCVQCNTFTQGELCTICQDATRDRSLLCVLETPADQAALERTLAYRGVYFVLMGSLSPLDGIGPKEIGLQRLFDRVGSINAQGQTEVKELILATNFTAEGEATAYVISETMKSRGVVVTRLSRGVPVGSELEYVDLGTIAHALVDRR